jgi:D-alanine-D-alanine ligase
VAIPSKIRGQLLRPKRDRPTRLLYVAEYAPEGPGFAPKAFPGDGGYPAYHHEIWRELVELGYDVNSSSSPQSVLFSHGNTDLVFSLYNRMPLNNSEVLISAFCEFVRVPCLGARPNIRALAEDKWLTKLAAKALGVPTAVGIPYRDHESLSKAPDFAGPYFVKERFGAGSEGIFEDCVQDTWEGAKRIAVRFLDRGLQVLVERFAVGLDLTVPILGGERPMILGFVHPVSNKVGNILTEDLKLDDPLGYELFPIDHAALGFISDAEALWDAAGPIDYYRMDYRYDPATQTRVFLEFNVCSFLGSSGAICLAASTFGLTQADVLGHVVEFSLRRQGVGRQHLQWVH